MTNKTIVKPMDIITKQQRFKQLHLALQYCTYSGGEFSVWERIMINQERGQLLRYNDPKEFFEEPSPVYAHDEDLAKKINFIIDKIQVSGWMPS